MAPQLIIADLGGNELALTVAQGGVARPPSHVLTSRIVLGSLAWAGVCPGPSACICTLQGCNETNPPILFLSFFPLYRI